MQTQVNNPADTLDAEQQATTQLFELLKQEQAFLIAADIDGLNQLMPQKTGAIALMADLANRRYQTLAAAGFPGQETGMQEWLKNPASDKNAGSLWSALLATAQSAKEMNRINGLLINKHLNYSQNALNILRGNSTANNIYGRNGQATLTSNSRGVVIG